MEMNCMGVWPGNEGFISVKPFEPNQGWWHMLLQEHMQIAASNNALDIQRYGTWQTELTAWDAYIDPHPGMSKDVRALPNLRPCS